MMDLIQESLRYLLSLLYSGILSYTLEFAAVSAAFLSAFAAIASYYTATNANKIQRDFVNVQKPRVNCGISLFEIGDNRFVEISIENMSMLELMLESPLLFVIEGGQKKFERELTSGEFPGPRFFLRPFEVYRFRISYPSFSKGKYFVELRGGKNLRVKYENNPFEIPFVM